MHVCVCVCVCVCGKLARLVCSNLVWKCVCNGVGLYIGACSEVRT